MRMLVRSAVFFLLLLVASSAQAVLYISEDDMNRALATLDDSLAHSAKFIRERQAQIDRMTDSLRTRRDDAGLLIRIVDRYNAFNNDSALHYISDALNNKSISDKTPFRLRNAMLLPLTGFLETAQKIYDSIPAESIPADMLPFYYDSGRQMYSYMASATSRDRTVHDLMNARALERQERLLELLPRDGMEYKFNLAEHYFLKGEYGKAKALLEDVMDNVPVHSNLHARAAHHLSTIANMEKKQEAYTYYLAQSALSDVCAATREVAALQELGEHLYNTGDVSRSYTYLSHALANAVECGASIRMVESSRSLPIIAEAKSEQIAAKQRMIIIVLCIVLLLLLGLVALILVLRREMRRQVALQEGLRQANRAKEVYISQFLNLCSIYMDKLNQFCKIANRKIAAGKVDDLYRLTKSGKFVEEQSHEFYAVFDNAFIHLYPNFVARVNALLRPDAQIELKDGELLNTDLRILAFMRLGIEESSRIAQVLNYSLNTIYAYRNRTKARAIDRETFEEDIMKIPSDT